MERTLFLHHRIPLRAWPFLKRRIPLRAIAGSPPAPEARPRRHALAAQVTCGGLGRDLAHRHGIEIRGGEHRPDAMAATASGMALTPTISGRNPDFACASASSTPSAMASLAQRTASVPSHSSLRSEENVARRGAGIRPATSSAPRRPCVRQGIWKPAKRSMAGGGGRRSLEDDDRAAPAHLCEKIARDVVRKRAVVGADEGDTRGRRGRHDDVEQRDVRRVEAEDRVVHRGFVAR